MLSYRLQIALVWGLGPQAIDSERDHPCGEHGNTAEICAVHHLGIGPNDMPGCPPVQQRSDDNEGKFEHGGIRGIARQPETEARERAAAG
jgi:hypothetical protein